MDAKWLDILGLIVAMAGAIVLACGLIISKRQALSVGVSRMAVDDDKKNVCLPHVRNKRRESRFAIIGVILFVFGFLLQIAGSWAK